jgi:V/A-type H+/Na+-transporting ATPase subunit F
MARIVALGPAEEVAPYLAMGAEVLEARDPAGVAKALFELARDKSVAVVLLPEEGAEAAGEAVADFRTRSAAALLVLPGSTGSRGAALAEMKSFLERAIGVDLIGKE